MTETVDVISMMTQVTSRRDALAWFIRTQQSKNTARQYDQAIRDFESVNGSVDNGINREKISEWAARMTERGLTDSTINQRMAAMSSYLLFLDSLELDEDAKQVTRFIGKLRRKVSPYEKSQYLTIEQLRALLGSIDRTTVQGCRDYALFLMFVATGRRSTEIRTLRWKDFTVEGETAWYRWTGKGKKYSTGECPWEVWTAIIEWLNRSGRLVHMHDEDYIFTALGESARRLPRVSDGWMPGQAPLSMQTLGKLLQRYARKAGISGRVHIHMLRHSAAMLRSEAGEDLWAIQKFLDHSDIACTLIYMHKIQRKKDVGWMKIKDMLGITG